MNSTPLELQAIVEKLQGVAVPPEMQPWMVLARRLVELQRRQTHNDNEMRFHIARVHELEQDRAQHVSIENIFIDSMQAVLPPGGEKLWENL